MTNDSAELAPQRSTELPPSGRDQDVSARENDTERHFVDQLEALVPDMRAFARSLCRDADLADDIVQDACLKAWGARDRFIPGAPMKPWVFRIIRNTFVQHGRRAWRSESLDPADAEKALVVEDAAEWMTDCKVMQDALTHLPAKQRDALTMVLIAGFSYEEAGALLGCSDGTVKSRVSRGREALVGLMQRSGAAKTPAESPPADPQRAPPDGTPAEKPAAVIFSFPSPRQAA